MSKDWTGNSVAFMKTNGWENGSTQPRQEHDYYATDPKAAEMLLELDDFDNIWECACGAGHMAEVFRKAGKLWRATDLYDYGYEYQDFKDNFIDRIVDDINVYDVVTNPPYKYAAEFISKAMISLQPGRKLALFLPIRYLASKSWRKIFDKYPPYKIWVSSGRLICAPNGEFDKIKGSAVDYAWYIWHKGYDGETKLGWFN